MKAVVAAFNQEKALVGAFSVITNLRMELFQALFSTHFPCRSRAEPIHPVVQYSLWIKGEDNGASARNMAAWPQLWVVIWATRWWSLIDHNDWAVRFSKFTNLSHQLSEHFYIISTTINLDISIIYNLDNFELTRTARSKQLLVTIIWTWSDRDKWYL